MPIDFCQLLDEAKVKTGSDYKTAAALSVTPQRVSDWRKGRQPVPVADVVLLAQLAGLEPEAWAARAIVEEYEGAKRESLQKALKKSLAVIGAGVIVSGCTVVDYLTRCIDRQVAVPLRYMGFYPIPHPQMQRG